MGLHRAGISRLPSRFAFWSNLDVSEQQTIKRAVSFSGVGLHSGNRVNMTFLPAPAGSGIRFRRVDLDGKPEIEARFDNVVETTRSTTLGKGNIKLHTVEHVLATFAGYGVDNAIVELDANEPPVGDGSAREYCRMVQEAGLVAQEATREPYELKQPIQLQSGESLMQVFPDDRFRITCTSADKRGRFTQFYTLEINPKTWEKELSQARTFCFYEEIEFLIKNGLIKGGSLENAVVIRDDAVLTTEPLRYADEFVRHKMLDIVGDLSLLGRPLKGHLVALRPSHAANCELVKLIDAQMRKPAVVQDFGPPPVEAKPAETRPAPVEDPDLNNCLIDVVQIMELIPHRYPFLLVDRIAKIDGDRILGVKNVTMNEPFFQGHFPGHPIMPGVLQLEAMAQVAGILMRKRAGDKPQLAYFMSAEEVKWRKPVLPGDTLAIEVNLTKVRGKIGKAKCACKVRGETVSEAEVTFMLRDA